MLSIQERMAQAAEHISDHNAHGYSQPNRGCGGNETIRFSDGTHATISDSDMDCSEMVRQCVNAAFNREVIDYMWTGNEDYELRRVGFVRLPFSRSATRRGDILWVKGHTGIAIGGGMQADAHGDEYGGITGPNRGDQTGHEIERRSLRNTWTYIYRWPGGSGDDSKECSVDATIKFMKDTNIRSEPRISPETVVVENGYQTGETCKIDGLAINDGRVFGTYIGSSGKRRYVCMGATDRVEVL